MFDHYIPDFVCPSTVVPDDVLHLCHQEEARQQARESHNQASQPTGALVAARSQACPLLDRLVYVRRERAMLEGARRSKQSREVGLP